MRSTPVRHECTRSKVHGERLMISKYGSAVWPPHSAEVYIGFERASSCPRLISPTPIYIPLYIYIYIYIHYTRGFPVNLRVFTVHANFGNGAIAKRGWSKPRSRLARDQEEGTCGISAADRAESASRFSTLGPRPWMSGNCLLSSTLCTCRRLETFDKFWRTMNILPLAEQKIENIFWI